MGRRVFELVLPGTRRGGRPKERWLDWIVGPNNMQNVGAMGKDMYNRERWRRVVSATASPMNVWKWE